MTVSEKAGPQPRGWTPDPNHERYLLVRKVIDSDVRPYLQADGGDIELVAIEGDTVHVRMLGACVSCPSSRITLRQGVESRLQALVDPKLIVADMR